MAIDRKEIEVGGIDFSDVVDPSSSALAPISPDELLRDEWLEPLGISAYRLAKDIGVAPNRMTGILAGNRAITADTALRLGRYFSTDAESWLNLQAQYDLAVERQAHGDEIEKAVQPRAA